MSHLIELPATEVRYKKLRGAEPLVAVNTSYTWTSSSGEMFNYRSAFPLLLGLNPGHFMGRGGRYNRRRGRFRLLTSEPLAEFDSRPLSPEVKEEAEGNNHSQHPEPVRAIVQCERPALQDRLYVLDKYDQERKMPHIQAVGYHTYPAQR